MIKSKKQSFIIIGVFALVLMLGTVTYAFFNYTRTGSANTIRTGRIAFNSQQGNSINLTNVFPVDVSNGIPSNNANVGSVTINITGDTTYTEGVEYLVSAVNVSNTVGNKTLPISIDVSVASNTENDPATTLGTADTDYFTNRGTSANTSIYKVLAGETISNNDQLLVGYIKSGETGVDGNIVIKAYIDASKVAISDTYNETIPETDQYGTTTEWVNNRTVFTTQEWNSLQTNGVSFQIKVEANEGTWVDAPVAAGTIDSCPGCYFMYTENHYNYGTNGSTLADIASNNDTYSSNYNDIVFRNSNTLSIANNNFLGFTVSNGRIDKGYICGVFGSMDNITPFCIEGIENSSFATNSNKNLVMSIFSSAYNPNNTYTCTEDEYGIGCDDEEYNRVYYCGYNIENDRFLQCTSNSDLGNYADIIFWNDFGDNVEAVDIGDGYMYDCYLKNNGEFFCVDETT